MAWLPRGVVRGNVQRRADENGATFSGPPFVPSGARSTGTRYVRRVSASRLSIPICLSSVPDSSTGSRWVACKEFGNEIEASIAVAILDGAGIPAVVRSNDSVGLFGSAFQGFSAFGVTLLVPSAALEAAKTTLALARPVDE